MSFARNQAPAALGIVPAREQWQRVLRWEAGLRAIDAKLAVDPDELFDFAIALAQNTFAMRDWLMGSFPDRAAEIRELFSRPRLKLIRDLANGSKHLELDPGRASVDANHMTVRVPAPGEPRTWVLAVLHRGYSPDQAVDWMGGHDGDGTILSGTHLVHLAYGGVADVETFMATVA
jgi:hypothetical protein